MVQLSPLVPLLILRAPPPQLRAYQLGPSVLQQPRWLPRRYRRPTCKQPADPEEPRQRLAVLLDNGPTEDVRDDIDRLFLLPCANDSCLVGDTQLADATRLGTLVSKDSTVTILWTSSEWATHAESARYWRHMVFWPRSTVLRRLLPLLTFFTGWSILATWLGLSMPPLAIAYSASPLALLLAFRVNAASSRFIEARQCWGRAVNAARNVAATVAASPLAPAQKEKCCRALCALGWAMKSSLRGDTELEGVLRTLLPEEVAGWVLEQRKTPLALLTLIRQTLANTPLFEGNNAISSTISSGLTELNNCYGTMERIFSTPLSPTYMRHTSRGMLLWLLLLPCAMTGSGSRAILPNVLTVLSVAYVMLGIDEIGIQIEQPFDVLPLHALATMLTLDVAAELAPTVPIPDV